MTVIRRGSLVEWLEHAERLAERVTHPVSRWRPVIAALPRHLFVPRWWSWSAAGPGLGSQVWELCDGPADEQGWLRSAYSDRSLVTRVGPVHADHAEPGDRQMGVPTSSATLSGLVVQMLRHAQLDDGADVLDVGTGSGYGCAVLARRLGDRHVTSVDVDTYLTSIAAVRHAEGDQVSIGRYPIVNVVEAWELWSMLGILAPGIEHHYQHDDNGRRTAWMLHPDGSWARATSDDGEAPTIHQSGPRRLWDIMDDLRHSWLRDGSLPAYGASVTIFPDGVCHLKRGRWRATITT